MRSSEAAASKTLQLGQDAKAPGMSRWYPSQKAASSAQRRVGPSSGYSDDGVIGESWTGSSGDKSGELRQWEKALEEKARQLELKERKLAQQLLHLNHTSTAGRSRNAGELANLDEERFARARGEAWGERSQAAGGRDMEESESDQLAKFSKHIGHGSNNALKNLLLLCIDVEAFRYLTEPDDMNIYAHEMFTQLAAVLAFAHRLAWQYLKPGARRWCGLPDSALKEFQSRFTDGGMDTKMFDRVQVDMMAIDRDEEKEEDGKRETLSFKHLLPALAEFRRVRDT
ncbi:hypothetical protein GUITHDRAFT_144206 [Guillardia theta CCMP2712]|uniref:Uncharacterized protein n=1 Tax=Guillardia theta (strain CCMP2712) TaxID=905079 RepID=L1IRG6_GUITC|nr:hypothetical protein GUITHDRAFT_144206 [Guillardia theta CCMP2712]EKX38420.1 hypothetical protein GUITHDRAFT_144206 [Guillardia theta CCMP2712]|eukprot:XP_005825400.1 hypothetical protein GUITHDRAFT_144206 [Guillardia theta CCMP2712]